jgi:hypothetical protein
LDLPTAQLVVNQTQQQDPQYQVFIFEDGAQPQLRAVNLPQPLGIRRLAEVGLWSMAQAKFDTLRAERILAGTDLTASEREQYALIARHARLISEQMEGLPPLNSDVSPAVLKEWVYAQLLAGEWQTALQVLNRYAYADQAIADLLQERNAHIWQRITAIRQVASMPDLQGYSAWGALTELARSGLPASEAWLDQNQARTLANLSLLQRMDLAPIAIKPEVLVGRGTPVGDVRPYGDWLIPPPLLPNGQIWFTVEIDVIGDRAEWLNSPFPPLVDRSSLLIWRVLGLAHRPQLTLTTPINRRVFGLTAHSYRISPSGQLQLLATGDQGIPELLKLEPANTPPLVTNAPLPQVKDTLALPLSFVPLSIRQAMFTNLYQELQPLGTIDVTLEQLTVLGRSWQFYSLDFNGDGEQELFLPLSRRQINLGDRPYPAVVIFDKGGKILFSDLNQQGGKSWRANLIKEKVTTIPLLIEEAGRFQVWQLPTQTSQGINPPLNNYR